MSLAGIPAGLTGKAPGRDGRFALGVTMISMVFMRHLLTWMVNLIEPSAKVGLGDLMAPAAGLGLGAFHRVDLQEAVEAILLAPPAAEVVVAEVAGAQVGDYGVLPLGQLDGEPLDFAAE